MNPSSQLFIDEFGSDISKLSLFRPGQRYEVLAPELIACSDHIVRPAVKLLQVSLPDTEPLDRTLIEDVELFDPDFWSISDIINSLCRILKLDDQAVIARLIKAKILISPGGKK